VLKIRFQKYFLTSSGKNVYLEYVNPQVGVMKLSVALEQTHHRLNDDMSSLSLCSYCGLFIRSPL